MKAKYFPKKWVSSMFYRVVLPSSKLDITGWEGVVVYEDEELTNPVELSEPFDCDALIFHQPSLNHEMWAMEQAKKQGIRVIVDIDDFIPAFRHYGAGFREYKSSMIRKAVDMADVVTVSTYRLREHYGGVIVPNAIPSEILGWKDTPKTNNAVVWHGSLEYRDRDHVPAGEHINRFITENKKAFYHIGGDETLGHIFNAYVHHHTTPLESIYRHLSENQFGVVLMDNTEFNLCKSWLKGLEFSACGIPWVGPPMPEYRALGAGMLAKDPSDYYTFLSLLKHYDNFWLEEQERNFEIAKQRTFENQIHNWREVWLAE